MTAIAAVAVALGAVAQAATGFGFSLVSAPFLIAAYRAPTGVQLNLVLSVAINLALLARDYRHADTRAAGRMLLPAAVTTVLVGYAVRHAERGPMTVASGLICLAGVAAVASGHQFRRLRGRAGSTLVGAVSGGMNVASGIGGPPVVLFALNANWPRERARPTMQLFFLGINAIALLSLGWPRHLPLGVLAGFAAGALAGPRLAASLPATGVRRATFAIASVGCVLAVARGLAG